MVTLRGKVPTLVLVI